MNFYINVISWGEKNIYGFTKERNHEIQNFFKKRVDIILELANYRQEFLPFNEELAYEPVIFVKRNADLDSVLHLVSPDIRVDLLTYFDFRLENDIQGKQSILKRLADYFEPDRDKYNLVNRKLTSKIFQLFNNCNIRHANDRQMQFESDVEQLEYYDICFNLILHLLREGKIEEYYEKIDKKS